jgi:uncharacterized YigZ family protein
VEDAKKYVQSIKDEHPDATHHVVAMTIGKTGEYGQANDDGEPSGTAGLPVLDVFRKNDITNFVCVVTRYFGGIKLGAGGLVRAYSKSASENLHQMNIVPIIEYGYIKITFNYPYLNEIDLMLKNYEILERSFTTDVSYLIKLPKVDIDITIKKLIALTNSLINIHIINNEERD